MAFDRRRQVRYGRWRPQAGARRCVVRSRVDGKIGVEDSRGLRNRGELIVGRLHVDVDDRARTLSNLDICSQRFSRRALLGTLGLGVAASALLRPAPAQAREEAQRCLLRPRTEGGTGVRKGKTRGTAKPTSAPSAEEAGNRQSAIGVGGDKGTLLPTAGCPLPIAEGSDPACAGAVPAGVLPRLHQPISCIFLQERAGFGRSTCARRCIDIP